MPRDRVDPSGSELKQTRFPALLMAVSGLALVATLLRLLHLGSKSVWVDECASMTFAQQPWREFWTTMGQGEANMVAYYLLLRGWIHFGNTEFVVRFLSVIPAVATVWVIYLLGKRLFSARVGLVGALLLSVNPCHVAYSQEARSYALLVFLSALSLLTFVIAIEHSTAANWFLYAVVTTASVYAHFFAGLLILGQWFSLILLPRPLLDRRKFFLSALGIGLATLPALWFILKKDVGQLEFIPNPGFMEVYRLLLFLTSYGGKVYGVLLAIVYVISLGACIRLFSEKWRHSRHSIEFWHFALLLSCLLLPVFLDMTISRLGKQMFYYRYLIICLPALIVLVARGFCSLRSPYLLVTGLIIVSFLSLATVQRYYSTPKENWRGATRYLLGNSHPNDTIIVYPIYAELPLSYYQQQFHPLPSGVHVVPAELYPVEAPGFRRPPLVWLLSCRQDSFLRSYQKDLSEAYSHHHELRYDGSVVLEEYSDQELTSRNYQDINPGVGSASRLVR